MTHIFGAKNETASVSYLSEFTLRLIRKLFPPKKLKSEGDTTECLQYFFYFDI